MIITKTPFRVSLCGGGSDLPAFYEKNGGCVISTTIKKYMYITSHPSFDKHQTVLKYSKTEIVNDKLTCTNNRINEFLKKSSNNIVILINLMEKSAKNLYESLGDKKLTSTTVQGLIPGSYGDISQLIEEYKKENKIEER